MKAHLAIVCGVFAVVSTVSLPLRSASDEPVFRVGHGVTAPRPLNRPDPEYSEEARRAGLQGKCILSVVVNSEGKTEDIQVSQSLGMGLDEKAVGAIRQWTFEPARKNGKPVAVRIQVTTTFRTGTGLGKMPPDLRKRFESGRNAAEEYAWKHVYRVEASTTDSLCRPTHEQDQDNRVSIPGMTPERRGYQLQSITFIGSKTFYAFALRSMFSIRDGESFDPAKVADGLQQLKKAYGSQGFVSFKASVDPEIDDSRRSIALRSNVRKAISSMWITSTSWDLIKMRFKNCEALYT